jgi:hypothetical protein
MSEPSFKNRPRTEYIGKRFDVLARFYDFAMSTRELFNYTRTNRIDLKLVSQDYVFGVCLCCGVGSIVESFDFSPNGGPCAVLTVLSEKPEYVMDLAAWPIHNPRAVRLALQEAELIGAEQATNPACFFHGPLRIHRTPLSFLQAGAQGMVLLRQRGARWLPDAVGPLEVEDEPHRRELLAAVKLWAPRRPPPEIVVSEARMGA